jgi:hypothetical protein
LYGALAHRYAKNGEPRHGKKERNQAGRCNRETNAAAGSRNPQKLSQNEGKIGEAVRAEARTLLQAVDLDETADEGFFVLDSIDVEDCWDRSGSSRYGYTEPSEAAVELVEEELQPFYDQAARYCELNMPEQDMT